MDSKEYKQKRNERIKHLYRTGTSISKISLMLAVDEKLINDVCKKEKRVEINSRWNYSNRYDT